MAYNYNRETEFLYTNSKYLLNKEFSFDKIDLISNEKAIEKSEAQEQLLYNRYNCKNYNEFIDTIKRIFNNPKTAADLDVIKRFQFVPLLSELGKFKQRKMSTFKSQVGESTIEVVLNTQNAEEDVQKALEKLTSDIKQDKEKPLTFDMQLDAKKFRDFISEARRIITGGKRLSGGSNTNITQAMREFIEKQEKSKDGLIVFNTKTGSNGTHKLSEVIDMDRKMMAFPWGFTKKEIEKALDEENPDPILKQQLELAYEEVHTFFTETLISGGSPEMKRAAEIVWYEKLGNQLDTRFEFFEVGNAIFKQIGAGGEYAAALLFVYFDLKFGQTGEEIAKIAGDELILGQQGKADLHLLNTLGVQVKNYNVHPGQDAVERLIETHSNPGVYSKYLGDQGEDFRIFFANYYFNKSFAEQEGRKETYERTINMMREHLYTLYNLALSDAVKNDQVNFYLIGGQFLVPASEILKSAITEKRGDSLKVKAPWNQKTDAELEPLSNNYWSNINGKWTPTEANYKSYRHYTYNAITFHSSFNYDVFINKLSNNRFSLY